MTLAYHDALTVIENIITIASDGRGGMNQLIDYCDVHLPNPVWTRIRNLAFENDILFNPDDQTTDRAVWDADSYLPEKMYADSNILHNMYRLINENNEFSDGEYIACLGYGCLVVKAICNTLSPELLSEITSRAIVVGFDSGDWIALKRF